MGRGKLKLEFITNEKTRKTTFLKRKKGMLKKAIDFSILCRIDVCLLISGPKLDSDDDNKSWPTEFETWPPERSKVMNIIDKNQASILRKPLKKVYGLNDAFVERKKKIEAEISRCRKKLSEAKYPTSLDLIEHFSLAEMTELNHRLDGKIEAIQLVIEANKENDELNNKKYQDLPLIEGPVFNDPMAEIQQSGPFGFDNATTAEIQRMPLASYIGFSNCVQYSRTATSAMQCPVFGNPTTGMLPENMNSDGVMTTYGSDGGGCGESSSVQVQAQFYPPLQVQPPSVPYMQYPMNVIDLARRIGPM